jgi:hypothetical protein
MILRQSELEAWDEDPEEWVLESAGDVVSAEGTLRTTAEALFMDLVSNYKDELIKFIGECIQSLHRISVLVCHLIQTPICPRLKLSSERQFTMPLH